MIRHIQHIKGLFARRFSPILPHLFREIPALDFEAELSDFILVSIASDRGRRRCFVGEIQTSSESPLQCCE